MGFGKWFGDLLEEARERERLNNAGEGNSSSCHDFTLPYRTAEQVRKFLQESYEGVKDCGGIKVFNPIPEIDGKIKCKFPIVRKINLEGTDSIRILKKCKLREMTSTAGRILESCSTNRMLGGKPLPWYWAIRVIPQSNTFYSLTNASRYDSQLEEMFETEKCPENFRFARHTGLTRSNRHITWKLEGGETFTLIY